MEVVLDVCPIFVRKLLNNTKIGFGWRIKAGIPKFVIKVSIGVCGWDMEVGLEMRPIFVRKLIINNNKIGIEWRNKVRILKFVFRSLMLSEVNI